MSPSQKKIKLKIQPTNSDEEHYIGIVSTEADYKISLILNSNLSLNLKSSTSVFKTINNIELGFSRFSSSSKYSDASYDLISNKKGKSVLLSGIPSIDYLFRVKGISSPDALSGIIKKLRNIKEITGVFMLDNNKQLDKTIIDTIP